MHRVGQFVAHVRARVEPSEEALVERVLPRARRRRCFGRCRSRIDVTASTSRSGCSPPATTTATCSPRRSSTMRARGIGCASGTGSPASCSRRFAPGALRRLASPDPGSWRYPFHLYLHHEAISAEMAVSAGCEPRTGSFIRGQPRETDAPLQAALKAADDAS